MMDDPSIFADNRLTIIITAILVKKLGGNVRITQADIDDIAFNRLEQVLEDGTFILRSIARKTAS